MAHRFFVETDFLKYAATEKAVYRGEQRSLWQTAFPNALLLTDNQRYGAK